MTYNPLDPAVTANPYPQYAKLRAEEPVKWLEQMQGFAVSRWEDITALLSDGRSYSSAQFWPALLGEYDPVPEVPPMISLDPPGHMRIRRLANVAFVPSRVGALRGNIAETSRTLIDEIFAKHRREGEFDFVREFSGLFPVSVIADVLGVDRAMRVDFKHWVDDLLSAGNRSMSRRMDHRPTASSAQTATPTPSTPCRTCPRFRSTSCACQILEQTFLQTENSGIKA